VNQDFPAEELIIEHHGVLAVVTLNRPNKLNALSEGMIGNLTAALDRWENDAAVGAVFIRGAGERAFCAGGDIKTFHEKGTAFREGKTGLDVPAAYFAGEYAMNARVFHYSKPIISFMNGITMGGGYGIAGNSAYRVATDKTVFAMPEAGIGFFPDVGSVYHLLRVKENIGRYLALTGISIPALDMMYAGLAEYFIPEERGEALIARLAKDLEEGEPDIIKPVLDSFSEKRLVTIPLAQRGDVIETIFGLRDIFEILDALKADGSPWALEAAEALRKKSPSSIRVTLEYLNRAGGMDIDTVLATDLRLAKKFLAHPDLYEGIRAAVLDKSVPPRWEPARLEDVSAAEVERYFT
jgi:enoyl-CoA hydratase